MAYDENLEQALLEAVAALLAPVLTDAGVFDYRTAEMYQVYRGVALTVSRLLPVRGTTAGSGAWVEVAIGIAAEHDNTPASIEAAERAVGEISGYVFTTLDGTKNNIWSQVQWDRPWIRPSAPQGAQQYRVGECYPKFLLK